jgi:hypothetical protein
MRAALTALRSLSLTARTIDNANRIETLLEMRDRLQLLLQDNGLPEDQAGGISWQIIHWLRLSWGGRTLTRQWWGFSSSAPLLEEQQALLNVTADPVKSRRGRELRAVVWSILVASNLAPRSCFTASDIAVLIETEWSGIYLPKGDELDREERDRQLYEMFDGMGTIDRIRETLGLSQSRAYETYKRILTEKSNREQPGFKF